MPQVDTPSMDKPQANPASDHGMLPFRTAERRGEGRTVVADLTCDAGRIIDLSTRGMRLISRKRWRTGETRSLVLTDGSHSVTIDARCIWDRHDGVFQHTVGLAFDRVAPEHEGMLIRFATEHLAA